MKQKLQNNLFIKLICAGILIFATQGLFAQQSVSGRVTDAADGQGVPGANVVVKGTTTGAITDLEGNYSINVPDPNAVLVYSYIGYLDQEIVVGSQTLIDIALEEDVQALDEVVVIGYGTVKKDDLTGSVAVVTSEQLSKTPATSLARAIQGRASGVLVTQSGNPGSGPTIRIRGVGSINQDPNPLYVIDGVIGGSLNNINPNDIESFQVLKDASAAAIYGADGANGVIIVTTKRGSIGKPKVNFSAFGSFNMVPKQFDVMNAQQYVDFYNTIYDDNGIERQEAYTDEFREYYYGEGWENGTEWQDEIIQKAWTQNYFLGVSGGGEASNYSISANILDENGILRSSGAKKYSFRANSDFKLGKYLKIGESLAFARNTVSSTGSWQGGAWSTPLIASPLMKVYNEENKGGYDGPQEPVPFITMAGDTVSYNNTGGNDKPNVRPAMDLSQLNSDYNSFLGSIYLEIKPTKWLTFKTTPSAIGSFNHTRNWNPSFESGVRDRELSTLDENYSENITLSIQNQLTFAESFGKHNISLTGVQQARTFNGYSSNVRSSGFEYENLNTLQNANSYDNVTGYINPVRWNSYLGRLMYDYAGKYLLTASMRWDGNSRFGPGNRWGTFPSVSAAWKLNEDLLPNVDAIDMIKLRAGYGKTGNSNIGNFQYEANLSSYSQFSPVLGVSQGVVPALNVLDSFGNELIQWESSSMTNIGMDASFFRHRLSATAEYYVKTTNNLIVSRSVSAIFGRIADPKVNLGDIENRGFEFNVSFRDMEGDFNYEITGMVTTIKNEVVNIPETYISGNNIARDGNTVGSLLGWIAERIITPGDYDAEGNYLHAVPAEGVPEPGDLKFTDLNLDGVINDDDRTIIGKPIPDMIYSLNVNLYYKSFDFTMYWYGAKNVDVFDSQRAGIECFWSQDLDHNKALDYSQNYYRIDRPSTEYVRADISNSNRNDRISTWWVEDASFLRLKDLQVGYTLPQHAAAAVGMSKLRIYASAVNLWTITGYKGRDPEAPTVGSPMSSGTDGGSYPLPRILSMGLQINF
ncbi:MAG: TonB-dependent receptor [Bacteroides sp.]|nr:TonB-dependent receptor [Bacteroides sp.]